MAVWIFNPNAVMNNVQDCFFGYVKLYGKFIKRYPTIGVQLPYCCSLSHCQFRIAIAFVTANFLWACVAPMASADCCATFSGHVNHVVAMSSEKQVIGPNTKPIVAFMTNHHAGLDGANIYFVTDTVGLSIPTISTTFPDDSVSDFSNTMLRIPVAFCTSPNPASVCLLDFIPETTFYRDALIHFVGHSDIYYGLSVTDCQDTWGLKNGR